MSCIFVMTSSSLVSVVFENLVSLNPGRRCLSYNSAALLASELGGLILSALGGVACLRFGRRAFRRVERRCLPQRYEAALVPGTGCPSRLRIGRRLFVPDSGCVTCLRNVLHFVFQRWVSPFLFCRHCLSHRWAAFLVNELRGAACLRSARLLVSSWGRSACLRLRRRC